jgi:autotransporter-associated beta strand protein
VLHWSVRISTTAGATCTINGGTARTINTGAAGSFLDIDTAIILGPGGGTFSYTVANVLNIVNAPSVTGTGPLTKTGVGVLAVSAPMTYSGATIINDGELRIRTSTDRIPIASDVTVNSPGILNLNGVSQQIGSLTGNGFVGLAGATLTIGGATSTTYSGVIKTTANAGASGSAGTGGNVTRQGTGTLTLSGLNDYTGLLTLTAGGIVVDTTGALCNPVCDVLVNGGALTLNNTVQTIEDLGGSGGTITLGAGHTLTLNVVNAAANRSRNYSGVIAGAGSIVKAGGLTETFSGVNTYSGSTTIGAGKLFVTPANAATGSYSVAGGAALGALQTTPGAAANVNDLTFNVGSAVEFDFAYAGYPGAKLLNVGTISVGTTTVNVKGFDTAGGPVSLLEYTGPRTGAGGFSLGAVPPRVTASITDDTVNQKVILNVSAADSVVWVSDGSGIWDTNNPLNVVWKLANAATPTFYQETSVQGDTVRFDDTTTGTATVTLATNVNPFRVTVDNSTTNYTFTGTGKVSGLTSLTKSGTGLLSLGTVNDYSGGTTQNGGSIAFATNSPLGTGKLTLTGTSTNRSDSSTARTLSVPVDLSGDVTLGDAIANGPLTMSGAWTILGGARQITVPDTVSNIISGAIGGAQGLIKAGGGTLDLTPANTFNGGLSVTAGTIRVNNNASLGAASSPVTLSDGITLATTTTTARTLTYNWKVNGNVALGQASSGTAALTLAGGMGLGGGTRTFSVSNITDTISAVITNGGLTKAGSGILVLSGNNTYSGNTTINEGALSLNGTVVTPFGDGSGSLNLNGGNLISTADRGTTANNIKNPMNMTADTEFQSATTTGTRNLVFGGVITGSAGTLTLHNTETTNGAALFDVRFTNSFTFARPIVLAVDAAGNNTQLSVWNRLDLGDQTYSGIISGPGSIRRSTTTPNTGGKVILSAANTYSGGTSLNDGEIALGSDCTGGPDAPTSGPVGVGAVTMNNDNGKLSASGGPRDLFNHLLFSSGGKHLTFLGANDLTLSGNVDLAGQGVTFTNLNTGSCTISGIISNGSVTNQGPGVLTLIGAKTYAGNTMVNGGTLRVNGSLASPTVTVNSGGTLGGNGTVGAVVVNAGGSVGAGASAGILTIANGLSLSANGTNVWELAANSTSNPGADFDQISLTGGNLVLGGSSRLLVKFIGAATFPDTNNVFWQTSHQWTIIAGSGSASNPGLSNFSAVHGATGNNAGTFGTSVDASGNVTLTFTPAAVGAPVVSPTIVGAGTTSAQVSWSSVPGESYTVQYKANLDQPDWVDLTNLQATGATTTIVDSTTPAPTQRFYRVISP